MHGRCRIIKQIFGGGAQSAAVCMSKVEIDAIQLQNTVDGEVVDEN